MNMSNFRISLDIHDEASQLSFSVKKGDTSRRLYITLTENGMPYRIGKDCYAVFSAVKPDDKVIYNDCIIKDNTIIYDMTEQTTSASGRCECELILYGGNAEQLTSPRFSVIVYSPVHSAGDIASTSEYTALANLVNDGRSVLEDFASEITKYSNALKGKASGAIIRVDDASPINHTVKCKVKNKNLFNNTNDFYIASGASCTYNCGTLVVNGYYASKIITLEEEKTYTLSFKSTRTGSYGGGVYIAASPFVLFSGASIMSNTVTFTVPKGHRSVQFTFYGSNSTDSNSASYTEIMLEEGTVATGYIPWSDAITATVMRCGKNLLDLSRATFTSATRNDAVNGITCKINNSYYSGIRIDYLNDFLLANKGKTLTFSIADAIEGAMITLLIYGTRTSGKSNQEGSSTGKREISFPISEEFTAITGLEVRVNRKTTAFTDTATVVRNMQVEVADYATAFEVFKESVTYSPGADGTIEGITSLSPTMTFIASKANAVVDVEYNKDINQTITKLLNGLNPSAKIAEVSLWADAWIGTQSPYSQVVSIAGVTPNSQVDLTPSVEQLSIFHNKDLAFVTENENGIVTVYAIGQKPTNNYIMQVTITEVEI